MSAVGIDFGNENCYIAVARAGGSIEIITNDYSQRATPSYVAFGKTCRDLGTSAKNKNITNLSNTVSDFKRLIGKKFQDPVLQHEMSYLPNALHELPNGNLGVKVSYLGKDVVFTMHQITAMMFTKLKSIAETALGTKVTDCVVSVPIFFTDAERRAMLDVCKIAGLHVLQLMNENAAVALAYGFNREDFSDENTKKVVFIDVGHSAVQATACEFSDRKVKILANTWDLCLGGRDIDNAMALHFCQDFQSKYNLNVMTSCPATFRLMQECEKLKKQLSANPQDLPLNIECFMEDKDVNSCLGREKLEELTSDILGRIEDVFTRLLKESDLKPEDIFSVELVGGTTRMPAIKSLIKKVFRMEPSTTLNLDEAVARGCALQAALLSPALKFKDFSICEVQPYPIILSWANSESKGDMEVFSKNDRIPFSKLMTLFRKEDFVLEACYPKDNLYQDDLIGSFLIKDVAQGSPGEPVTVKVKIRLNVHGIFTIRSAVILGKDFKNTPIDQKRKDILDIEMEKNSDGNIFFLKKHRREIKLKIEPKVPELSESEMKTLKECERKMIQQDLETDQIDVVKNSKEYICELRSYLGEDFEKFIEKEKLDNFANRLSYLENWIYKEENQDLEAYLENLSELITMADPIRRRKFEHDRRPEMLDICQKLLTGYQQSSDNDSKDMETMQRKIGEKNTWFQQQKYVFSQLLPHQDPPVSIEQLWNEMKNLEQEILSIAESVQRSAEQ